jgi:hypothetical protein
MSKKIFRNFLVGLSSTLMSTYSFSGQVIAKEYTLTSKDSAALCNSNPTACQASLEASKLSFKIYEEYKGVKRSEEQIKKDIAEQGWNSIQFINAPGNAQAVLAKKELNGINYYAIIFRGTEGNDDLGTDFKIGKTSFLDDGSSQVHEGFLEYTNAIYKDPATEKFLLEAFADPKAEFLSTGHSLGGASAEIFTAMLKKKNVNKKIHTIVFGAPPPGNKIFADKYLKDVIKVKTDYDPITSSTTTGILVLKGLFGMIDWDGYSDDYGTTIKIKEGTNISNAHTAYEDKIKSILDEKITSINADNFNLYNSCITQASASHITSSSCFMRPKDSSTAFASTNIFDKGNSIAKIRTEQEKGIYTNGIIVNAPLDITLTWNYSTQLDLDSHLVTPNESHVYFNNRGSLDMPPNAFLYRDSIPDPSIKLTNGASRIGAEQTRITTFNPGEYRFYVHNFSESLGTVSSKGNNISTSGAKVNIFEGGKPLSNQPNDPKSFDFNNESYQNVGNPYKDGDFSVPINQSGNTWYVFKLNTRTGILTPVNSSGNQTTINVPTVR